MVVSGRRVRKTEDNSSVSSGRCRCVFEIDYITNALPSLWDVSFVVVVGVIFYHLATTLCRGTQESFSVRPPMAHKLGSITIAPKEKHTATVVFIHGLGDTGHGWTPVADMFCKDSKLAHIKWILPHSPRRPVAATMGIEMPSWFDIYSFGFNAAEDEDGMLTSVELIRQLIREEIRSGIDPSRIVLGGFSQGGAMSLLTALTSGFKLAGIVCLSGWLPLQHKINSMATPDAVCTPIFWGHGTVDQLVQLDFSKKSVELLTTKMGVIQGEPGAFGGLSYHIYDGMGHTTNQSELEDLKAFIKNAVPFEDIDPQDLSSLEIST